MGKYTKENGLIKYNNNIFSRVKRFFWKKLWRKKNISHHEVDELDENTNVENICKEENTKKRSLYNFDAENEDFVGSDGTNMREGLENREDFERLIRQEGSEDIYNVPLAEDAVGMKDGELEDEFIGMKKKELTVEEEKEELERKLKKYYESIKKIANLSL
ncbi:MAG: hypothetical protein IKD76_01740 [Clostridia bacterium]|nr:hypothetical protein [Clostridia bacterium]